MSAETCSGPDDCRGVDDCVTCQTDVCAEHPGAGTTPCRAGGLHCSPECARSCGRCGNRDRVVGRHHEDDFTTTVEGAAAYERERARDYADDERF